MNGQSQKPFENWRQETDSDGITWLCLDKAEGSANVLSSAVLLEFDDILGQLEANPPRGLVIYSGKNNGFVMGADINEFTSIKTAEQGFELIRLGQKLFDRLEALRCPTISAISGFCLGGGFELAMACTYRLALANKKPIIGLPEVQLGLHPGFGGTVRSVRMAGVRNAMQLMLTGKPIRVDKALHQGFIDRIATPDNWKQAAKELLASRKPKSTAPFLDKLLNLFFLRPFIVHALKAQVAGKARREHYPSPYAMIDLWSRYGAKGVQSYEAEAPCKID
jgi:3-hydroxyacyl-CoA dehydrogenase/enoyl-CoA hydratase/3-hydroxybutyryl-CoA epimerase